MTAYYAVLGLLLFASFFEIFTDKKETESTQKWLFYLSIFMLALFFGTRGYVGWDWRAYKPVFDEVSLSNMTFEKGFSLYMLLIKKIYPNYHFFVFLDTFIEFFIIQWLFRKYSLSPIFSLFLFFGIQGIPLETDLLRNMKGILLFLISIEYIFKKNLFCFLSVNFIGLLFHGSSLLYFPMYFILNRSWNKIWITVIFLLGNVYYFLQPKFFIKFMTAAAGVLPNGIAQKIYGYISILPENIQLGLTSFYFERLITFIFLILFMDRIKNYKYKNIMANSFYIFTFIFLFTSELSIASVRIGILFIYSYWFVWPMIISNSYNLPLRVAALLLAVSISSFRFYNHISFKGNQMVYPYENILSGYDNYDSKLKTLEEAYRFKDEGHGKELLLLY